MRGLVLDLDIKGFESWFMLKFPQTKIYKIVVSLTYITDG